MRQHNISRQNLYWLFALTGLYFLLYPIVWDRLWGQPAGWVYTDLYLVMLIAWFAAGFIILRIDRRGGSKKTNNSEAEDSV